MTTNTQVFMGRYEMLAEIGRGTMGVVYKARDPKIDRIVAVKTILLSDLAPTDGREYRERFYQEARAAGRLSHPGIVTIYDVGTNPENHNPYLVMEYVAGSSLDKLLLGNKDGLPLGPALQLVQEIAEALDCAHSQGVIHRDIKPENILITTEGRAKVADFGIARMDQSHLTRVGQVMGSPAYMAPEQLTGEISDARSDLFSLGVVLYTVLTGHRPFQGNSTATVCFKLVHRDPIPVSAWSVDLPPDLDQLLARALAKDPVDRFQTGSEMAQDEPRNRSGPLWRSKDGPSSFVTS
jgi:serine/threonine protein kinase